MLKKVLIFIIAFMMLMGLSIEDMSAYQYNECITEEEIDKVVLVTYDQLKNVQDIDIKDSLSKIFLISDNIDNIIKTSKHYMESMVSILLFEFEEYITHQCMGCHKCCHSDILLEDQSEVIKTSYKSFVLSFTEHITSVGFIPQKITP